VFEVISGVCWLEEAGWDTVLKSPRVVTWGKIVWLLLCESRFGRWLDDRFDFLILG
jgi:hypothetical protein